MKNSKVLFLDLVNQIKIADSRDEIQSMVYMILEDLFSVSRTDILAEKEIEMKQEDEKKIAGIVARINNNEPVQYILGHTEFYGRKFIVNTSVLIPRPETEELVSVIVMHFNSRDRINDRIRILDIGTGSGCISITLAMEIREAEVFATDISLKALDVAMENAKKLNAPVQFFNNDILKNEIPARDLDVVVSNPPYIGLNERASMKNNVLSFEPHLALFVPNDDPLIFYKSIAEKAKRVLRKEGLLAFEINEQFGNGVAALLKGFGFADVQIVNDIFGKERIVKGILR